ncbi:hypothetical protein TNCT_576941 [Trichonephila clavata]|uniref:Uncharacterized protein n=1 Tax=Trichonephila clavata TaxID=2740835 RepID=A0A8X6JL33_TRICU|nr:hypothetical protein TNCT_576941 [Trichonephila clavata]
MLRKARKRENKAQVNKVVFRMAEWVWHPTSASFAEGGHLLVSAQADWSNVKQCEDLMTQKNEKMVLKYHAFQKTLGRITRQL